MLHQLKHMGMAHFFERLEATPIPIDGLRLARQMACRSSHTRILEKNLHSKQHIHVFEDDVTLCTNYRQTLDELLMQIPYKWDILYTGINLSNFENYELSAFLAANRTTASVLDLQKCRFDGAFSYLVHKDAISKIHNILKTEQPSEPIDTLLLRHINSGNIVAYGVFPTFAKHSYSFGSSIDDDDNRLAYRIIIGGLYQEFFYTHYNQQEVAQIVQKIGEELGYKIKESIKILDDITIINALASLHSMSVIKRAGVFTPSLSY